MFRVTCNKNYTDTTTLNKEGDHSRSDAPRHSMQLLLQGVTQSTRDGSSVGSWELLSSLINSIADENRTWLSQKCCDVYGRCHSILVCRQTTFLKVPPKSHLHSSSRTTHDQKTTKNFSELLYQNLICFSSSKSTSHEIT